MEGFKTFAELKVVDDKFKVEFASTFNLWEGNKYKSNILKYKKDYESKYDEDVSTFGGHAYDALMILVEAIKTAGTDKEKVRDAIEKIQGFPGTGGIFNFSAKDHNGLGIDSFEMLTVKDGKFVVYKK